jgi:hypothetical protein
MPLLVLAALVAGCGGGSSSSMTTTSASKGRGSEYADQANAVCRGTREANAARAEEFEEILAHGLTSPAVRDEAAELLTDSIPTVEAELKGLEGLTAPAGLAHTQGRMISKARWSIALDRLFVKALEHGSTHELGVLFARIASNELAFRGAALHLGLKVCGKLLQNPESAHGLA